MQPGLRHLLSVVSPEVPNLYQLVLLSRAQWVLLPTMQQLQPQRRRQLAYHVPKP